jgi:hypothetical protein
MKARADFRLLKTADRKRNIAGFGNFNACMAQLFDTNQTDAAGGAPGARWVTCGAARLARGVVSSG